MKRKRNIYGLMGLLSLLGFIGIFTKERGFLAFLLSSLILDTFS